MRFKTYVEIPYHTWTIQQTWHTSIDRPGPDGFDRVAVQGDRSVKQGPAESWANFYHRLDVLDGLCPAKRDGHGHLVLAKGPAPKRSPAAGAPSHQSLFEEVV
jgi:hypothetical protein